MTLRVAVTGAGGPAAISVMQALAGDDVDVVAADSDPYAPGLYLAQPEHRWIVHGGDDPRFADEVLSLCVEERVDVLIPTVDAELLPLARRVVDFERHGISVLLARQPTLTVCLDKAELIARCSSVCPTPRTEVLDDDTDLTAWSCPCLVKPRRGAGGRGVAVMDAGAVPSHVPRDGSYIIQELVAGEEYSVDMLCTPHGETVAAVPRSRLRIDFGTAVTGRTVHDSELQRHAMSVARHLGVTFVANLKFRRDSEGVPRLLDVNARFPATMALTIAAGVNMPRLALDLLLGKTLPENAGEFRDIGMVRFSQDRIVATGEIESLERRADAHRSMTFPIRLPRSA